MKREKLEVKLPLALNTVDDVDKLLPTEVSENENVIILPNGSIGTHPRWRHIKVVHESKTIERILVIHLVDTEYMERSLMVYGHYSSPGAKMGDTTGFVGRITLDDISGDEASVQIIKDEINPYNIPQFVNYREYVYITLSYMGVFKYGKEDSFMVTSSTIPLSPVGAYFRGRLWVADCGILKFTEIGEETVEPENAITLGNEEDPITAIIAQNDRVLAFKEREIYDYRYGTGISGDAENAADSIYFGVLKNISQKVGCSHHTMIKVHFDELRFTNRNGTYIMNPQQAIVSERAVVVEPNIVKISEPVDNLHKDIDLFYYNFKEFSDDAMQDGDFDSLNNLECPTDGEHEGELIFEKESEWTFLEVNPTLFVNEYHFRFSYWYQQSFTVSGSADIRLSAVSLKSIRTNPTMFTPVVIATLKITTNSGAILYQREITDREIAYNVLQFNDLEIDEDLVLEAGEIYKIRIEMAGVASGYLDVSYVQYESPGYYLGGMFETNDPAIYPVFWNPWIDLCFKLKVQSYKESGDAVYGEIAPAEVYEWGNVTFDRNQPIDTSMILYLKAYNDTTWYEINPPCAVPDELKKVQTLNWKVEYTSDGLRTPVIAGFGITYQRQNGEIESTGFRDGRYYIFAKDNEGDLLYLGYDNRFGWFRLKQSEDALEYSDIDEEIPFGDYHFIGCGRADNDNAGCLIYDPDPFSEGYRDLPTKLTTGKIFLDTPEMPKKLRKFLLSYKGEGIKLTLSSAGITKLFNLDDTNSEYVLKELNFGTPRTKWFSLSIEADLALGIQKLVALIKFFKDNQV